MVCRSVAPEIAAHFKDAALALLTSAGDPADVVVSCLAAIARRTGVSESRSLLTGEAGFATISMTNTWGRLVSPGDVMFTVLI